GADNGNGALLDVYKSVDGGATWTAKGVTEPLLSNPLYVVCYSQSYDQGWYDNVIAVDPTDENTVWVGGIDLWRSDDGATTWSPVSSWWESASYYAHADQHAIVFHPGYNGTSNQTMFFGNDGGIFKTTTAAAAAGTLSCGSANSGVTFTDLNNSY